MAPQAFHVAATQAETQAISDVFSKAITVSGKPIVARSGDLVLLPVNEPHGLNATTRFKMMLTMLRS